MPDDAWAPPKKAEEIYERMGSHMFSAINRPTAGARSEDAVPTGSAPLQLYSLATPNGQKPGILLEELGIEYDAHTCNIGTGVQFSRGFVDVNPNSKIPCALDRAPAGGGEPVRLFESGAIMLWGAAADNSLPEASSRVMANVHSLTHAPL